MRGRQTVPPKTKDGEDVPTSALKRMEKDWERQKKACGDWKANSRLKIPISTGIFQYLI